MNKEAGVAPVKDEKEFELLRLLAMDSRLSAQTLATLVGTSQEEVEQTLRALEQNHVILRYSTVIDWEKVASPRVTAVIDVKVIPQREVGFDAIAERIYRFPEVRSVFLMSGGNDLQVTVEESDLRSISRFVSDKLATIENVHSTTTHFMLKKYKEAGVIFDDHEDDRRLVVAP